MTIFIGLAVLLFCIGAALAWSQGFPSAWTEKDGW